MKSSVYCIEMMLLVFITVHQDYQTFYLKATDPFIIMDWKEYLIYIESETFGSMNRRTELSYTGWNEWEVDLWFHTRGSEA